MVLLASVLLLRRRLASPKPGDASVGERPSKWYLRWFRWAVIPTDAGLAQKASRKSQSLPGVDDGRRRRPRQKGAQGDKSRYWWNCGDLQGGAFGRARFPGCADVVPLMR